MKFLLKNTWIIYIALSTGFGLMLKFKSKKYIRANPELKEGYDKFVKRLLLFSNIQWIIMGVGNISGVTNNVFEYFNPSQMNPAVLIYHATVILLWSLSVWWIYYNNGAEFLEKHSGLVQMVSFNGIKNVSAGQIKLFFPLMVVGGVSEIIMMWAMTLPPILH